MTLLPPLSPFGQIDSVLSKHRALFPGPVSTAVYSVPGSLVLHCCSTNYLHRMCTEGLDGRLFTASCYEIQLREVPEVTLRLPVFPFVESSQGAELFVPSD